MGATRTRMSRTSRRACLAWGVALSLTLALATNALALSGTPVKLGEGQHFGPPAIAVTASGAAIVAWADEAAIPYTIKYCVLPVGASACTQTNTLTPAGGSNAHIDGVKVLVDGATIVLLADVYGAGEEYAPEQEWTSTDGGASFSVVSGGKSIAEGILNADTGPLNPVIVPGSNVLGYAWVTAAGPPTFAAFPLTSPPQCSVQAGQTCPFATLQPEGEHILSNEAGFFASQLGANPGVLGVYETLAKPGCASGTFDTAYVYASGEQSATNNYNISPGTANSAWKVGLSPADCEVEYPAVGGGPSGFGVVEDNLAGHATVYHRFDQATNSFDTPSVTIAQESEQSPSVSQDGAGGVYATYLAGFEGEVRLAYSNNGGATWTGPATLSAAGGSHLVSSVDAAGQGWATWSVGESVYAQPFVASDATLAPAIASGASSTGTTITITITCAVIPCTVTITITVTESGKAAAAGKKRHPKAITLGSGRFTITSKGAHTLGVHLTKAGKRYLAAHHGRASAKLAVAEKLNGATSSSTQAIKITPAKHKHK